MKANTQGNLTERSGHRHTPGPWSVGGKYTHKSVLLNARGESIASGGNNRSVQGEELEASLRLAAAAPDLLAALQPFVKFNSSEETLTITVRTADITRARAAIAKAEGRA